MLPTPPFAAGWPHRVPSARSEPHGPWPDPSAPPARLRGGGSGTGRRISRPRVRPEGAQGGRRLRRPYGGLRQAPLRPVSSPADRSVLVQERHLLELRRSPHGGAGGLRSRPSLANGRGLPAVRPVAALRTANRGGIRRRPMQCRVRHRQEPRLPRYCRPGRRGWRHRRPCRHPAYPETRRCVRTQCTRALRDLGRRVCSHRQPRGPRCLFSRDPPPTPEELACTAQAIETDVCRLLSRRAKRAAEPPEAPGAGARERDVLKRFAQARPARTTLG